MIALLLNFFFFTQCVFGLFLFDLKYVIIVMYKYGESNTVTIFFASHGFRKFRHLKSSLIFVLCLQYSTSACQIIKSVFREKNTLL